MCFDCCGGTLKMPSSSCTVNIFLFNTVHFTWSKNTFTSYKWNLEEVTVIKGWRGAGRNKIWNHNSDIRFDIRISEMHSSKRLGAQISWNVVTWLGIGLKYLPPNKHWSIPCGFCYFFFLLVSTVDSEWDQSHIIINKFSLSHKITAAFGEILESRDRTVAMFLQIPLLSCTGGVKQREAACRLVLFLFITFLGLKKEHPRKAFFWETVTA